MRMSINTPITDAGIVVLYLHDEDVGGEYVEAEVARGLELKLAAAQTTLKWAQHEAITQGEHAVAMTEMAQALHAALTEAEAALNDIAVSPSTINQFHAGNTAALALNRIAEAKKCQPRLATLSAPQPE